MLTNIPVKTDATSVPIPVPMISPSNIIIESITEMVTQRISKKIFTRPNLYFDVSETALTKASLEFKIMSAQTESAIPKLRIMTPEKTVTSCVAKASTFKKEIHHKPKSVKIPNAIASGI